MPSQKIEKTSNLVLKKFSMMEAQIPQTNSNAQLVAATNDSRSTSSERLNASRTLRDVKVYEWIAVIILCFVNLINYMDRFTIAGILGDIQTFFDIQDDKAGLLQTGFVLSYMIFAPIFGYMGDRYNRSVIMSGGVLLWSITTLLGSYMDNYWGFLFFRALVGIGEASYSTIAPTIISDLFVGDLRSKMLALFYFAIPVGSGLGYIVGSETAKMMHSWKWALRVTPALGVIAVLLLFFVLKDPGRGESEGTANLAPSTYKEDLKEVLTNRSFIFSSGGFTCVAFVAGALSWWAPKFIELGIKLQSSDGVTPMKDESVSFQFGVISMFSGLIGVPLGSVIAQKLRPRFKRIDAYLSAFALIASAPLVFFAFIMASKNTSVCFVLVFFAELFLNLTWAVVADILLYVVMPNRRSTAEGVQLLVSHALGDAGSPSLVGVLSDMFRNKLNKSKTSTLSFQASKADIDSFKALQYALFLTTFVEILGGLFFLITAFYIVEDRKKVERAVRGPLEKEKSEETSIEGTTDLASSNSQQLLTNDTEQALID